MHFNYSWILVAEPTNNAGRNKIMSRTTDLGMNFCVMIVRVLNCFKRCLTNATDDCHDDTFSYYFGYPSLCTFSFEVLLLLLLLTLLDRQQKILVERHQ